jgi:hypothetical protein
MAFPWRQRLADAKIAQGQHAMPTQKNAATKTKNKNHNTGT